MIKVSVLYPNSENAKFDNNYYATTHIPMVIELLGDSLKSGEINVGLAGGQPDSPAPFDFIILILYSYVNIAEAETRIVSLPLAALQK